MISLYPIVGLLMATAGYAKPLDGKVAVITGASSGIGKVVGKELASKGMKVVLAARRTDKLKAVVDEITASGGTAMASKCDVSKAADVSAMFDSATKAYGGVDFVYINAAIEGSFQKKPFVDFDDEEIAQLSEINIVGSMYTIKYGVKALKARGGGTFAFSSSIAALVPAGLNYTAIGLPEGSLIPYSASKMAMDRMAMDLAGSAYAGINVYNLNIGCFDSEMGSRLGFGDVGAPNLLNPVVPKNGDPIHIAHVITALLDGTSKWAPGSAIVIDNDVTLNSKYFFDVMYESTPAILWRRSADELKKVSFDVKGDPYVWKDEL